MTRPEAAVLIREFYEALTANTLLTIKTLLGTPSHRAAPGTTPRGQLASSEAER